MQIDNNKLFKMWEAQNSLSFLVNIILSWICKNLAQEVW